MLILWNPTMTISLSSLFCVHAAELTLSYIHKKDDSQVSNGKYRMNSHVLYLKETWRSFLSCLAEDWVDEPPETDTMNQSTNICFPPWNMKHYSKSKIQFKNRGLLCGQTWGLFQKDQGVSFPCLVICLALKQSPVCLCKAYSKLSG